MLFDKHTKGLHVRWDWQGVNTGDTGSGTLAESEQMCGGCATVADGTTGPCKAAQKEDAPGQCASPGRRIMYGR